MVGTGVSTLSGEETESPQLKLVTASPPWSIKSSSGSNFKASSPGSISSNTLTLLLSDDHCDSIDEAVLVQKLIELETRATEWERKVYSEYTAGQARVIDGLHNLLLNIVNGFGDRNDHGQYEYLLSKDASGSLLKVATVGVKWSKKMFLTSTLFSLYHDYVTGKKTLTKKRKTVLWPRIMDCDVESDDMERLLQIKILSLCDAKAAARRRIQT